ncbi:outer membrane beta-barrel protein [Endozoicomonas ascidiicola]|uniref:outer membrane beta-barrel protein n=1 Tax=Endozoicomonas ascidiicola TaxID=1698521 RepID=UPI000829B8B1|nr:outer membrane beta-barrel protein [Endozoicomonas ascidiicola]
MMNKCIITASLYLVSQFVNADFYVGMEYAELDVDYQSESRDIGTISVIGGTPIKDYLVIEARAGIGTDSDSNKDIDLLYGVYGKLGRVIGRFYPYALFGYTQVKGTDDDEQISESDTSYGAGVSYQVSDKTSVSLNYMKHIDDNELSIDGASLQFVHHY